jgi:hypothetical protein
MEFLFPSPLQGHEPLTKPNTKSYTVQRQKKTEKQLKNTTENSIIWSSLHLQH